MPKFSVGKTVITPGALDVISMDVLLESMRRHHSGDWGDVGKEDWQRNEEALQDGSRLLSVYHTPEEKTFWIITEADRSVTTALLPEEY